ncbi:MAG: ribonucleotide reductase stimulatory protein [Lactovum sp.]
MKIAYFSVTGQTRRFIDKISLPAVEILPDDPMIEMEGPFILIVPTYERAVTDPVWEFMNWAGNSTYCRGIVGGGNRNFAGLFIYTANDLAIDFNSEVLYGFEFNGTDKDVAWVKNWIQEFERQERK